MGRRADGEIADARQWGAHIMFIATVVAIARGKPAEPLIHHRRSDATTRSL